MTTDEAIDVTVDVTDVAPAKPYDPLAIRPFLDGKAGLDALYDHWRRLRTSSPMVWSATFRGYVLHQYGDVRRALQSPLFSSDVIAPAVTALRRKHGVSAEDADQLIEGDFSRRVMLRMLVFQDPPDHTWLREILAPVCSAAAVRAIEEPIALEVDRLVAARPPEEGVDVMRDIATPLAGYALSRFLGLPEENAQEWGRRRLRTRERWTPPAGQNDLAGLGMMLDDAAKLVKEARRLPVGGVLAALLAAEEAGRLSVAAVVAQVLTLLIAGLHTTMGLITNAILLLLQHPDQLARLRADRALMAGAVDECLRIGFPVIGVRRALAEAATVYGQNLKAGDRMFLLIASANRDPDEFAEPDRFDITRPPKLQLALGYGVHYCLGAGLAQLQLRVVLERFLLPRPELRLDEGATPEWREHSERLGVANLLLRA